MSAASGFPRWKVGRTPKRPTKIPRLSKKARRDRDELAAARPVLLERSRGRCEARVSPRCTGVGVQAHHVERRVHGGTNTPDNLVWLCWFCHDRIHANPIEAMARGLLRAPGQAK
jgi:hypothetical protein